MRTRGFFFDATNYNPGSYLQIVFLLVGGFSMVIFASSFERNEFFTERAEQRSQAKTELLNILSHDLKTRLTVIASYTEALKSTALGQINSDQ